MLFYLTLSCTHICKTSLSLQVYLFWLKYEVQLYHISQKIYYFKTFKVNFYLIYLLIFIYLFYLTTCYYYCRSQRNINLKNRGNIWQQLELIVLCNDIHGIIKCLLVCRLETGVQIQDISTNVVRVSSVVIKNYFKTFVK